MSDGSWELQQAVFGILDALHLVSGGIYAPAPENAALPYIEIGASDAVASDVQCRQGLDEALTIHVWTKPGSNKVAKQAIAGIRDALHAKKLTVSGRASALAFIESSRVFLDEDGKALHGVVTLRVIHHATI